MTIIEKTQDWITVGDLIDTLKDIDPNTPIAIVSDYGDRSHTQQACPIDSIDFENNAHLYETGYSQSRLAIRIDPDPDKIDDFDGDDLGGADENHDLEPIDLLIINI